MTHCTTAGDHSQSLSGSRAPIDEGQRSKSDTINRLARLFINELERVSRAGDNTEEVSSVLCAYLEILDVFDKERAGARQEAFDAIEDWVGNVEVAKKQVAGTQKRDRGDEGKSDNTTKHPIDLELIPFGRSDSVKVPDDLRVTHELQDNYARDPAYAKIMLLRDPSHPEFPSDLWGNILANTFIDLNQIFSQIFYPVDRQSSGSDDWVYAWDRYEKAVLFAFPHRELELQQYKMHIQELFVTLPGATQDILQYDHRVRKRVAESGSLRLCDISEFSSDYLWVVLDGELDHPMSESGSEH
jgi:hypothetical protein